MRLPNSSFSSRASALSSVAQLRRSSPGSSPASVAEITRSSQRAFKILATSASTRSLGRRVFTRERRGGGRASCRRSLLRVIRRRQRSHEVQRTAGHQLLAGPRVLSGVVDERELTTGLSEFPEALDELCEHLGNWVT